MRTVLLITSLVLAIVDVDRAECAVTVFPESVEALPGANATFSCYTNTSRTVQWVRADPDSNSSISDVIYDGRDVTAPFAARFSVAAGRGFFNLTVAQSQKADAGRYVCREMISGSYASALYTVLYPPEDIIIHGLTVNNTIHVDGMLTCAARSVLSINYTWTDWTRGSVVEGQYYTLGHPTGIRKLSCAAKNSIGTVIYTDRCNITIRVTETVGAATYWYERQVDEGSCEVLVAEGKTKSTATTTTTTSTSTDYYYYTVVYVCVGCCGGILLIYLIIQILYCVMYGIECLFCICCG